jgi:hypothetical protein
MRAGDQEPPAGREAALDVSEKGVGRVKMLDGLEAHYHVKRRVERGNGGFERVGVGSVKLEAGCGVPAAGEVNRGSVTIDADHFRCAEQFQDVGAIPGAARDVENALARTEARGKQIAHEMFAGREALGGAERQEALGRVDAAELLVPGFEIQEDLTPLVAGDRRRAGRRGTAQSALPEARGRRAETPLPSGPLPPAGKRGARASRLRAIRFICYDRPEFIILAKSVRRCPPPPRGPVTAPMPTGT